MISWVVCLLRLCSEYIYLAGSRWLSTVLYHPREVERRSSIRLFIPATNMPSRVTFERRGSDSSSEDSNHSYRSWSTAPTVYSDRHSLNIYRTALHDDPTDLEEWRDSCYAGANARSSVETYASTLASDDGFDEHEHPIYEEPEYYDDAPAATAYPSTPSDFAYLFPSTRRLCIRHDDTTDGNMNLRVDTEACLSEGKPSKLTLFHLRMHDLKNREFSLRRYCRASGREVCHSTRKYTRPTVDRRPGIHRSMSNALASLRHKSDNKSTTLMGVKRQDSGYESMSEDDDDDGSDRSSVRGLGHGSIPLPTNTIQIEFSNYAHVDLKRRGATGFKRYDFDYWGTSYTWKRTVRRQGKSKQVSYHCVSADDGHSIAHIVPTPMTPAEAQEEEGKGGWVPPSSMWISDETILSRQTDMAE